MNHLSLLLSLFCTLHLTAQNNPKTLLWEITRPGAPHKSYLFGTFHEVGPVFFTTLTAATEHLKNAEVLLVEEASGPSAAVPEPMAYLSVWSKAQWESLLTTEQHAIFEDFIQRAERPDFYRLPPLVLARTITGMYFQEFCAAENMSAESMDYGIEKLALQQQKPVQSLDENQVELLKSTSLSLDSSQNAVYARQSTDLMDKMLTDDMSGCRLLNLYKNFDVDYQLDTDLTQSPDFSPLLIDRNNRWLVTLEAVLRTRACFIAVGLRHLFYRQGLIEQLRARGYKVRPVPVR